MNLLIVTRKKVIGLFALILCAIFCVSALAFCISVTTNTANRKIPIYNVDRSEKVASLTFDAAWGADKTLKILEILKQNNIKATFFLVGFWVDNYQEMVRKIESEGHEIGTHSETHPHMTQLSKAKMASELDSSSKKITDLTGKKVEVFRAPFGDYNNQLLEVCEEKGLFPIQWNVDSLDWKNLSAQEIHSRVVAKTVGGSIVLFHNNSLNILEALPMVIMTLRMKGYTFKPVGELIYKTDFFVDSNGVQRQKKI